RPKGAAKLTRGDKPGVSLCPTSPPLPRWSGGAPPWSTNRELVTWNGPLPDSGSLEDVKRPRDVSPRRTLSEVLLRAQCGELLRNRNVDELINGHALRFRHLARLLHQRRLKSQGEVALLHGCLLSRSRACAGPRTSSPG